MIKQIITMLATSFFALQAFAQPDWQDVERYLQRLYQDPAFVEETLDSYRLTGHSREVFREHFNALYKNPEVTKAIVSELRDMRFDKNATTKQLREAGRQFGSEYFLSKVMSGLNRLPTPDQRAFILFILKWMNHASADDCKRLLVASGQSGKEDQFLEIKYYNRFAQAEIQQYLTIARRAFLAEIRNFPLARTFNSEQIIMADQLLESELEEKIMAQSQNLGLMEAIVDMESASPKDACDAGKLIFATVYDLRGFVGDLAVNKFIASMSN